MVLQKFVDGKLLLDLQHVVRTTLIPSCANRLILECHYCHLIPALLHALALSSVAEAIVDHYI